MRIMAVTTSHIYLRITQNKAYEGLCEHYNDYYHIFIK
jgi:hypothetical protein